MAQQAPAAAGGLVLTRRKNPVVGAAKGLRDFAKKKPLGAICLGVLVLFWLTAIFANQIDRYDPTVQLSGQALKGISSEHWLGTDHLGRDLWSRLVHGARISVTVGFAAVMIGKAGGVTLGLISGFRGGKLDLFIQRFVDAWLAFPNIILLLAVVTMLGPSLMNVIFAIGVASMPGTTRLVRSTVLSAKENDYVMAARALGAREPRILFRHILPNVTAPIIVSASVTLGAAILAESSLSFLGLGIPPPAPSWGGMLSREGREYMMINPTLAIWPGLAITTVVMAFNLLGDALRDVWDPRLRGSR
jgi:peptide/nickel transport system permease protein